ncbi:MAG: DUF2892 domain-containing protein [Nanohaloarchaea archaeon SW_7_43_1]|nr:MAG: DUF2892 domain-containing protein [Nanohaloarchaea archaeon SW_7_43_1]
MEENVGGLDQQVRVAVGAVFGLAALAILGGYTGSYNTPMWVSPVLGVLSLGLLGTAYTCECRLNELLEINTAQ